MNAIFQKVEPVSKKITVIRLLKQAILSGAIQPGEQLVEGRVAVQFGVGQGLLREALFELSTSREVLTAKDSCTLRSNVWTTTRKSSTPFTPEIPRWASN
jgi:DNA-binding FadR family transcriptional regulator